MVADFHLHRAILIAITAGLAALAGGAKAAGPADGASRPASPAVTPARSCSFGAFVAETDPAGLNVREAPSTAARVLGRLPPTFVEPAMNYGVRVEVEVIGVRDGWFLIRNAKDNADLTGRPARPMYSGRGWVGGSKLTVKSQADAGRARPARAAAVHLRVGDGETFDGDSFIEAARLSDCQGDWAQVEFADQRFPAQDRATLKVEPAARAGLPSGRFRVWVDRLCGIQETSCS